jgi:hypothetical protein
MEADFSAKSAAEYAPPSIDYASPVRQRQEYRPHLREAPVPRCDLSLDKSIGWMYLLNKSKTCYLPRLPQKGSPACGRVQKIRKGRASIRRITSAAFHLPLAKQTLDAKGEESVKNDSIGVNRSDNHLEVIGRVRLLFLVGWVLVGVVMLTVLSALEMDRMLRLYLGGITAMMYLLGAFVLMIVRLIVEKAAEECQIEGPTKLNHRS